MAVSARVTADAAPRKPPRLRAGDTVGVCAPASSWENRSELLRGVAGLEAWGLQVSLADHINDRHGYMAGRDVVRLLADQARIRASCPWSRRPKAASKLRACCCQEPSLVKGARGDSASTGMPARKRAVSLGDAVSAPCACSARKPWN